MNRRKEKKSKVLSLHAWLVFGAVSCVSSVNTVDGDNGIRDAVDRSCSVSLFQTNTAQQKCSVDEKLSITGFKVTALSDILIML